MIALGGDDGQAALAQERDDRAACRERCEALLDDEADDAVARRFGDELAGDPLEPLEAGGRGLRRAARFLLRGVDLGVRDRQRDAVREFGGDLDLGGRIFPFRPDDEEHRPDRLAPGEQRLDDDAARAHRFDDVGDLGNVAGRAAERHRVGQVLDQDRPARPDGAGGGSARPDRRRERPDSVEAALSLRVAGDRRGSAERAVGLDEVDEAPVREVWNRERARGLDRLVEVVRLVETEPGVGDQPGEVGGPLAAGALLVDVGRRADPALDRAGLAAERHDPDHVPAVRAVVAPEADRRAERLLLRSGRGPGG